MAFETFAGAEAGAAGNPGSGVYVGATANDAIVASPGTFPGNWSFAADPVGGNPILEIYGFSARIPDAPRFVTVMSMYRFAGNFDDEVAIAELGIFTRRLTQDTTEELQIYDKDEDLVGETGAAPYVIKDTDYRYLWYTDVREATMTRDILWVYRPAVSFVSAGVTFADVDPDTMTMAVGEASQFIAGDVITVAGSASNNGVYTIAARAAGVITLVGGDTLANEGPVGATLSTPARWDKAIDVSGHESGTGGGGNLGGIDRITFGTSIGKGLPTVGGPFYTDEMCVQVLNKSPNTDPIGAITTAFLAATANGTDGDFDTGSGVGAHPDWQLVDEVPPDGVTTYDEGDVTGDKQSYEVANPGNTPLAVQVVGQAEKNGGAGSTLVQSYILEDGTQDSSETWSHALNYRVLRPTSAFIRTYNEINGQTITEGIVDGSEAGVELISATLGATFRLSQLGLETMVEHATISVPDDFPATEVTTIVPGAMGPAFGSANVGRF